MQFVDDNAAKDFLNLQTHCSTYAGMGFVMYPGTDATNRADICDALAHLGIARTDITVERDPVTYGHDVVKVKEPLDVEVLMLKSVKAGIDAFPNRSVLPVAVPSSTLHVAPPAQTLSQQQATKVSVLNGYPVNMAHAQCGVLAYTHYHTGYPLTQSEVVGLYAAMQALGIKHMKRVSSNGDHWLELDNVPEIQALAAMGVVGARNVTFPNAGMTATITFPLSRLARNDVNMLNNFSHDAIAAKSGIIIYPGGATTRIDILGALQRLGGTKARIENAYPGFTTPVVVLDDKAQVQALADPRIYLDAAVDAVKYHQSGAPSAPAASALSLTPVLTAAPAATAPIPQKQMSTEIERAVKWMTADVSEKRLISTMSSQDPTDPQLTSLVAMFAHPDVGVKAEIIHINDIDKLRHGYYVVVKNEAAIKHLSDEGSPEAAKITAQTAQSQSMPTPAPAVAALAAAPATAQVYTAGATVSGAPVKAVRSDDPFIADTIDKLDAPMSGGWKIDVDNSRIISIWSDAAEDDRGVEALRDLLKNAGAKAASIVQVGAKWHAAITGGDIETLAKNGWQTAVDYAEQKKAHDARDIGHYWD